MKIIVVDEYVDNMGGVQRVISTLANKLVKDNEVIVVSEFKTKDKSFYHYDNNVKINYLIDLTDAKTNNLKNKGIKYYFYKAIQKLHTNKNLSKKIENMTQTMKEADIIIFGRVYAALEFLPILKKYNIKTKIIVRDAIHLEHFSNKIKKQMSQYFPDMVYKFIVSSEESMQAYKTFFGEKTIDIIKVYNPLGIVPQEGFSFENKTIISVGRLDKQKGFENLIGAVSNIHIKYPDWCLYIYGDGYYEKSLRKYIDEYNADSYVKILPSIKNITKVFNNSSIFVLPSRYEGYANVLVEAMSCGMPCISYDWLMGVEEIIRHRENGLVVNLLDRKKYYDGETNQKDIESLAKMIEFAINNEDVCNEIGREATKIKENRDIDKIIDIWMEIIK